MGRNADAADETSTEGTARPLGIADAAPARKGLMVAEASDNPGQAPPRSAEASDNHDRVLPRPANWDQVTRGAKQRWRQRQKANRK